MRKFKVMIRIGRKVYTRDTPAETANMAVAQCMSDLWDVTKTDPEKMVLISSAEIL